VDNNPAVYDIFNGRQRVGATTDPKMVAFYAGIGYTTRIAQ